MTRSVLVSAALVAPPFDPRLGVALWLAAPGEGIGSARALDCLCANHNAFRWLTGSVSVNSHTLADFRVDHLDFLDGVLTPSVAVLRETAMDGLERPGGQVDDFAGDVELVGFEGGDIADEVRG